MKKYQPKYVILFLIIAFSSCNLIAQRISNLKGQAFSKEVLQSKLYNTEGDTTTLNDVLTSMRGKVILINFWASWCGTCHTEMKYVKNIQHQYNKKQIDFLFLSTDTKHNNWILDLKKINIKGQHYRIDKNSKKAIQELLNIKGIPYYVILDKNGNIFNPKAKWPHQEKLKKNINIALNTI